ncbi:extracellular protein [Lacticaseibacillus rhamnosus]|nr:extracellular protein [Lacticaseibacillus rhamnosus]
MSLNGQFKMCRPIKRVVPSDEKVATAGSFANRFYLSTIASASSRDTTSGEISFFEVEQPVNQPSPEQIKPKQQVNVPPPTKEDQLPALGMMTPLLVSLIGLLLVLLMLLILLTKQSNTNKKEEE